MIRISYRLPQEKLMINGKLPMIAGCPIDVSYGKICRCVFAYDR
jgi:hypothetical protein